MTDKPQCIFMVPERPYYIRYFQCSRKAVIGDYCRQHAEKVERRTIVPSE